MLHRTPAGLAYLAACTIAHAGLIDIYSTDFDDFPAGADTVVDTDGWSGNNTGIEVHGTDELVAGLGQSVFLGGVRPSSSPALLSKPVNYDPVAEGTPVISIDLIVGIQDSSTNRKDSFFFSLYNTAGNFLAAISFNNTDAQFGIYRHNGSTTTDTGDTFLRDEIMFLTLTIDFENNTWSAALDDVPIFDDAQFNASGRTLDLGFFTAEWWLTANSTLLFGDNFLLIDELSISAVTDDPVVGTEPFVITAATRTGNNVTLDWDGQAGFTYQVEHSDDLLTWSGTLPGSSFTPAADGPLAFTDTTASGARRYYRVHRTQN